MYGDARRWYHSSLSLRCRLPTRNFSFSFLALVTVCLHSTHPRCCCCRCCCPCHCDVLPLSPLGIILSTTHAVSVCSRLCSIVRETRRKEERRRRTQSSFSGSSGSIVPFARDFLFLSVVLSVHAMQETRSRSREICLFLATHMPPPLTIFPHTRDKEHHPFS